MQFDTALNLVWLLLGAMSLVITLGLSRRASFNSKWLHLIGVAAIVVALFPYISATDDVLRIEHFNAQQTHENGSKRSASDDLLRLYETLDSPLLCGSCRIALTLIFLSLLSAPAQYLIRRSIPLEAGRSPPLSYPA
ncbi:MAG: hypothetical protein ACJ73N_06560 [Bryobacteraceae bacterium]